MTIINIGIKEQAMPEKIKIDIELTEPAAMALAQFIKRVGFTDFKENAVDDPEAYLMRDGVSEVQTALARHGFNPR